MAGTAAARPQCGVSVSAQSCHISRAPERTLGDKDPLGDPSLPTIRTMQLRSLALEALCIQDPTEKVRATQALWMAQDAWAVDRQASVSPKPGLPLPGRPGRPHLIHPSQVPTRSPHTLAGRAALLHAICHIEFNAINLALDAVWRFNGMPLDFYKDWMRVAFEESQHFDMLRQQLQRMGGNSQAWDYGDFDAHDGLWAMCEKTKDDIVARMALVPRTLEARGLDATPIIQEKLSKVATPDAMAICGLLDTILRDEVGHVAIGNHWYRWLCERQQLDPVAHYGHLVAQYDAPKLKPPFNEAARRKAGFSDVEIGYLLGA